MTMSAPLVREGGLFYLLDTMCGEALDGGAELGEVVPAACGGGMPASCL